GAIRFGIRDFMGKSAGMEVGARLGRNSCPGSGSLRVGSTRRARLPEDRRRILDDGAQSLQHCRVRRDGGALVARSHLGRRQRSRRFLAETPLGTPPRRGSDIVYSKRWVGDRRCIRSCTRTQRRSSMKVKDAMHKGVDWVSPDTPVAELAKLM